MLLFILNIINKKKLPDFFFKMIYRQEGADPQTNWFLFYTSHCIYIMNEICSKPIGLKYCFILYLHLIRTFNYTIFICFNFEIILTSAFALYSVAESLSL